MKVRLLSQPPSTSVVANSWPRCWGPFRSPQHFLGAQPRALLPEPALQLHLEGEAMVPGGTYLPHTTQSIRRSPPKCQGGALGAGGKGSFAER